MEYYFHTSWDKIHLNKHHPGYPRYYLRSKQHGHTNRYRYQPLLDFGQSNLR